jgi:RimJ/RimL family protein N-acetyltransferase
MIASRLPSPENPWMESYVILLKTPNESDVDGKPEVIGSIGTPRDDPAGAEIGYSLHPDHWGRGYGSEVVKLFIKHYWSPESK